ncbi:hypothetical protein A5819_001518 [Enterococcus sp. 7E2_DIV0204]|nr:MULTISPECIES: hypothetical protein [unclassified Enterococcus]OTN89026.1 hypothetical protein A5819_001518 [Enterococcus sp. 7E2_DIV0204]OTP51482.1 hypothetical protein A5884_000677 [Enterococcus sp. 7D2_DIV0200]
MNFLWIYILGGTSILTLLIFLVTFSKDVFLVKRLKKRKRSLWLNGSFLAITFISISLVIYLFILLRDQIQLLG